jgi:hypothetical protein
MISIEYYKGLPIEYESFLVERYDSFITTCRYIEAYHPDSEMNYILIFKNGSLIEVLMFENRGDTTKCMNRLVCIDQNIVSEFTKFIFENFPAIKKIEIIYSYNNYYLNKSFIMDLSNDYIINLPSTIDDYLSELGYNTRRNIKKQKSKLQRDYPHANFITKSGVEIEKSIIDRIIQLNTDRMKHKGIVPGKEIKKNDTYIYSQHYGVVNYIEIDGVIIAGILVYVLNKRVFGYVIAHDENFSKYDVGKICLICAIQTAIENRLSAFHLLWGDNDYKKRFLGQPHELVSYFVYKSYSFDFLLTKAKTTLSRTLLRIRQSELATPIRKAIKSYRKKNWKKKH